MTEQEVAVTDAVARQNVCDIIENIWQRARLNAFAHKVAGDRASRRSTIFFAFEVLLTLVSVLAVIFVYLLSSADGGIALVFPDKDSRATWGLAIAVASVICTLAALYLSILANSLKLDVVASEHKFLLGSYQHIAQRAREAKWPDKPYKELVELLRDLERDFQLLKARGSEPSDRDFDNALATFKKIRSDPTSKTAQSFDPEPSSKERPAAAQAKSAAR